MQGRFPVTSRKQSKLQVAQVRIYLFFVVDRSKHALKTCHILFCLHSECVAVAARNGENAANFAKGHEIPKSYGSYSQLLKDPEVDVVYIGSIADEHAKMSRQSLIAGKPTVVEKPLSLSAQETVELVQLAKKQNLLLV